MITTERDLLLEVIKAQKIINHVADEIKKLRGNLHDWEYISVHHGWTYWYKCKLCGKFGEENRELTKKDKEEECYFFTHPNINMIKKYLNI